MNVNLGGQGFVLPPALELYAQQGPAARPSRSVALAKKGAPWSDEEHRAFLRGLKMYGRGQWKQISRFYVPSRTPTQVASHAQKHFLRQSGAQKRRSRFSAVEEAAGGPAPALLPPLPLPGLHHASVGPLTSPPGAAPAAPATQPLALAAGIPGAPARYGVPAQHGFMATPPRLPGAPGSIVGGIAMGVPIGVLPPLPSITTATGTELPILPVMPGRINAMAAGALATASLPAPAPTTSYSSESHGSGAPLDSSSPSPSVAHDGRPPRSGATSAAPPPRGQYTPSSRTQHLLRLLELNEQLAGSSGDGDGPAPSSGAAPVPHFSWQQAGAAAQPAPVKRVPSATAALDTLALLAEAESESVDGAAAQPQPGSGSGGTPAPPSQHAASAPLVSAF